MTEREKIAARIRALSAKTVANGCTEEEALAAAAKVSEMLERYNLTVDEAEMRASPFAHEHRRFNDDVGERLWRVADGITHLTGAEYYRSQVGVVPVTISFFGFEHEVEVAVYLLEICTRAMRYEAGRLAARYALLRPDARRRKILPFLDGMADRLRERIRALKPATPTGRGLVVLHASLVQAAMADAGIKTKQRPGGNGRDREAGYGEGRRAADLVALNRGIGGSRVAGVLR